MRGNRYDDLDANVRVLYDDRRVLPDPSTRVGGVLLPDDVVPLLRIGAVLGPPIVGDAPDATYPSRSSYSREASERTASRTSARILG